MSARVRLSIVGRLVRVQASGLGDRFNDYLKATEGCRYVRKERASFVPIERVEQVVLRLRDAKIDHEATAELREVMQRTTKAAWNDLCAVRERIDRIDEEMATRSGERLFPFQRFGAQWLAPRRGALLADDQGLGKTRTTIAALPANAPVLVVGPSITKGVWAGEIARFRPQIRTRILSGRGSFRWPEAGEALLTSFELLPPPELLHAGGCDGRLPPEPCKGCRKIERFSPFGRGIETVIDGHVPECGGYKLKRPLEKCEGCAPDGKSHRSWCGGYKVDRQYCDGCHPMLSEVRPGTVFVVDEAHFLKTPSAQRTQAAKAIGSACRAKDGRTWELSGTPLENDARELYCVLSIAGIAEEAFGSYSNCVSIFKGRRVEYGKSGHMGYAWDDTSTIDQDDVVSRLKRVSLRRLKSEVLPQLPPKTWRTLTVAIDKRTYATCDQMLRSVDVEKLAAQIEKGREDLAFEGLSSIRAALATAKIPAMLEYVEEIEAQGEPLVVFSAHRAPLEKLALRKGWKAIIGGIDADEKTRIAESFQRGELKGVACSIRAAGVAITLHRANQMLFVDLDWKPTANAQAADRVCRIGQKRGCQMTILAGDHPLDERVSDILRKKTLLISHTIDASSVSDDAPRDEVLEAEIRRLQEAAACGRAVRREPESAAEREALEGLRTLDFSDVRDERIAVDLAREADAIGLSDAQWSLAIKIAARGTVPPPPAAVLLSSAEAEKEEPAHAPS